MWPAWAFGASADRLGNKGGLATPGPCGLHSIINGAEIQRLEGPEMFCRLRTEYHLPRGEKELVRKVAQLKKREVSGLKVPYAFV